MSDCQHRPGPVTSVDKYIDTARCLDCGRSLYYLTRQYEDLMLPGKNRVMERLDELQRASDLLFEQSVPKVQEQIKTTLVKPEGKVKVTTGNRVENMPNNMPGQTQNLPPVPERPVNKSPRSVNQYFVLNTPQILSEIGQIGQLATKERWEFSNIAWTRLCNRNSIVVESHQGQHKGKHNYPKNRKPAAQKTAKDKQKSDSHVHGTYASFPAFNETWAPQVQVKWLEIYRDLSAHGDLRNIDNLFTAEFVRFVQNCQEAAKKYGSKIDSDIVMEQAVELENNLPQILQEIMTKMHDSSDLSFTRGAVYIMGKLRDMLLGINNMESEYDHDEKS